LAAAGSAEQKINKGENKMVINSKECPGIVGYKQFTE
jgi:hypothetical protein